MNSYLSIFFLKRLSIHAVRHDNLIAVLNHSHNKQNFACNIILHVSFLKDIQLFSEFTLTNLSYTHWRRFDAYSFSSFLSNIFDLSVKYLEEIT